MQQAQQIQEQVELRPVRHLANTLFDMDSICDDEPTLSDDGCSLTYEGSSFHYELAEMYRGDDELIQTHVYAAYIPNAADNGDSNEITIESVSLNGQSGIVIYDVYQPRTNSDDEWICNGTLKVILTDADNHEARLKEELDRADASTKATIKELISKMLNNPAVQDGKADLVKEILSEMTADARYVFDKSVRDVVPAGSIDLGRAVAQAGDNIQSALDTSFSGACIAEILARHPKVESFTLELSTSQEHDDNDFYTSRTINVVDLAFVDGVSGVEMEDFGGEEFDASRYADYILDEIRDQSIEYDIHCGLAGSDDRSADTDVKVSRTALKHLLDADQVDGQAVADIVLATATEA